MEIKYLTKNQMEELLNEKNSGNRKLNPGKVKKYKKVIENGDWNFDFAEGNTLTLDTKGDILSAQHRLKAMLEAKIPVWKVWVAQIDRDFWLKHTVEGRSAIDKANMLTSSMDIPGERSQILEHLHQQFSAVTDPDISHARRSGVPLIEEKKRDIYKQMSEKAGEVLALIAEGKVKPTKPQEKAIAILYCFDKIRKQDVATILSDLSSISAHVHSEGKNNHHYLAHTMLHRITNPNSYPNLANDSHFNGIKASKL